MSTSDCKEKSNNDGVCEMNDMLQSMSTVDNEVNIVSVCANCGKEGNDINNTCNKCKQVKYCNAACKKKHRHKHKKQCEEHVRLAAERAAELHDEKLFKQPQKEEHCPICFLLLPSLITGSKYMSCCGKVICSGCVHAPLYDYQGNEVDNEKCPFCRTPTPDEYELIKREIERMDLGDPIAIYDMGNYYSRGEYGCPQDYRKALEHWHRAGELGYTPAYCNIGYVYKHGQGVEADTKKAVHYYELAAMGGNATARHNLGNREANAGNFYRALRHYMIAVRSGESNTLDEIKELYRYGHASKGDYTKALQLYQEYLGEIKSDQRDKAAAFSADHIVTISQLGLAVADEDCRYY